MLRMKVRDRMMYTFHAHTYTYRNGSSNRGYHDYTRYEIVPLALPGTATANVCLPATTLKSGHPFQTMEDPRQRAWPKVG